VTGDTTPGKPAATVEVAQATSPEKALGLEQDFIPPVQTKREKNRWKKMRYMINKRMKISAQNPANPDEDRKETQTGQVAQCCQEAEGGEEFSGCLNNPRNCGQDRPKGSNNECAKDHPQDCGQDKAKTSMPQPPKLDDFKPIKRLGHGGSSGVFLVQKKSGIDKDRLYAMKITNMSTILSRKKGVERLKNERYVHQNVTEYPFLAGMCYSFIIESKVSLMLEYYPGGDLANFLKERGPLSESDAWLYLAEIVMGVQHLHELGTIHRDLKPQNILLSADGHIAIADYGLSKKFLSYRKKHHTYSACGTPQYIAPEVIEEGGHGTEVDWWGVGVIAYEMLTGITAFEIGDDETVANLYGRTVFDERVLPDYFPPEATNFISAMKKNRESRRCNIKIKK
jgi:serine/threonine protein kinase